MQLITFVWTVGFGSGIGRGASKKRADKLYVWALDWTSQFVGRKKTNRRYERLGELSLALHAPVRLWLIFHRSEAVTPGS